MKKLIVMILVLCFIPTLSVHATPPIFPGTFDVVFSSCGNSTEYENIYFDLLIKPEDYMADESIATDQVNILYQNKFPNYQEYDFLIQGEFISYSAYIQPLFNQSADGCKFHLETGLNDTAEIYFIVFQDDGTLLYQEMFDVDDLGYGKAYKYYTSIEYDHKTNTAQLHTERVLTIGELFLLIVLGIVMFVLILIAVPILILWRHHRRRKMYHS